MDLIIFTHANTNKEAFINKAQIFGFSWSDAHKCFLLYSSAGGVFPVKEDKDQILTLLNKKGEK